MTYIVQVGSSYLAYLWLAKPEDRYHGTIYSSWADKDTAYRFSKLSTARKVARIWMDGPDPVHVRRVHQ